MGKRTHGYTKVARLCRQMLEGESISGVCKKNKLPFTTIHRLARNLVDAGVPIEIRAPIRLDTERARHTWQLFQTTKLSNRQISKEFGYAVECVRRDRHRYNAAQLRAGNELPTCQCGKYLHHPRGCAFRASSIEKSPSLTAEAAILARDALISGEAVKAVADAHSVAKHTIQRLVKRMTSVEREERTSNIKTREAQRRAAKIAALLERPASLDLSSNAVLRQISSAVPRGIDQALRDDIIGELHLRLIEGAFKLDQLGAAAKAEISRAYRQFACSWGDLSLDEIGANGRSMIANVTHSAWD